MITRKSTIKRLSKCQEGSVNCWCHDDTRYIRSQIQREKEGDLTKSYDKTLTKNWQNPDKKLTKSYDKYYNADRIC